jgi:hypothetical protein
MTVLLQELAAKEALLAEPFRDRREALAHVVHAHGGLIGAGVKVVRRDAQPRHDARRQSGSGQPVFLGPVLADLRSEVVIVSHGERLACELSRDAQAAVATDGLAVFLQRDEAHPPLRVLARLQRLEPLLSILC